MSTTTMLKTTTIKFKLGEEFEEERADGAKVKSIITLDGNKMTHVMKGEPESTIIREFNGDEMKAVSINFIRYLWKHQLIRLNFKIRLWKSTASCAPENTKQSKISHSQRYRLFNANMDKESTEDVPLVFH